MRYLENWNNFREADKLDEKFKDILPNLNNFKLLKGDRLISFFLDILPKQIKNLIESEVSKYNSKNYLLENLELSDSQKSEIINDLSIEQRYEVTELDNIEDIKKSLDEKGIDVDKETITRCSESINSISDSINKMRLGSLTTRFLKFASLCVFFFLVNTQSFSQKQNQDTTKVVKTITDFNPKLLKSSTAIDCFEYDQDGAYHIVEVPGITKKDLKLKLQKNINQLRLKINRRLIGNITQIKYSNYSEDEIRGEIQFKISPRNRNGVTEAEFVITVKDGKYKAQILNPKFIPVGQQRPGSPQFSDPIRNPERLQRETDRENERWRKDKRVRRECDLFFLELLAEFKETTPEF